MRVSCLSVSQVDVPGGSTACTAIAVVACASSLLRRHSMITPPLLELWVRQGAALYSSWRETYSAQRSAPYALASEILEHVSPAWPLRAGEEWGGALWEVENREQEDENVTFPEALGQITDEDACAVLTIGAVSVALLAGGLELFDSHPQQQHNEQSIFCSFDSRADLLAYLRQRFTFSHVPFSLCVVRLRPWRSPKTFRKLNGALEAVSRLPPGFLYVFAKDIGRGPKEYQVVGLDDFLHFYRDATERHFHDMVLSDRRVSFFGDLEFKQYAQNMVQGRDPDTMLRGFCAAVAAQWAEEGHEGDIMSSFSVFVSVPAGEFVPERDGLGGEDGEPPVLGPKISFHVHNHAMWFSGFEALGSFMQRVVRRQIEANEERATLLRVYRWKYHALVAEWFPDELVYGKHHCMRLPGSTKLDEEPRVLVPYSNEEEEKDDFSDAVRNALISPPLLELYLAPEEREQEQEQEHEHEVLSSSSGSTLSSLSSAPAAIQALGAAVERQFRPKRMRGFILERNGVVTFSMVKNDCVICERTHGNQVYVVADLKLRVYYQKCHANRSKAGPQIEFPASLGELNMAIASELDADTRTFPASSATAQMVLAFSECVYDNGKVATRRSAPAIPLPGMADVRLSEDHNSYEVQLVECCAEDECPLKLVISRSQLHIRCTGEGCPGRKRGQRWERPTHSSKAAGKWDLSFLFPFQRTSNHQDLAIVAEGAGDLELSSFSASAFLGEVNLFRALGFAANGSSVHEYKRRLALVLKLASASNESNAICAKVVQKCRVMQAILCSKSPVMEACYRECLVIADDFAYPVELVPRGPASLAIALWIHLARSRGFKRVNGDRFFIPATDEKGRNFYRPIAASEVLSSVCTFDKTPNLCAHIVWSKLGDDVRRLLEDRNQFPEVSLSKRYLGFANAVYDLEENVALTWEQVRASRDVMPFNCLDLQFSADALEKAKNECPSVSRDIETGEVRFSHSSLDFGQRTPLFDAALKDQGFSAPVIFWLMALLGRMFHRVGKIGGDNWEVCPFLCGAPSCFKSSLLALVMMFLQSDQFAVIAHRMDPNFPLEGIPGKLMAFIAECKECDIDRETFKLLASSEPMKVRTKYEKAHNVNWDIPVLFAGNGFMSSMPDPDGAIERRVVLFPFLRTLRDGQGVTDLASRIFAEEGAALLIKWNTLYLELRKSLSGLGRVYKLLPQELRAASCEAVRSGDSLQSFFAQMLIITGQKEDCMKWHDELWPAYVRWCRSSGRKPYSLDPTSIEGQVLFQRLGVSLDPTSGLSVVVGVRTRRHDDPPPQMTFRVQHVQRTNADDNTARNDEVDQDEEDQEEEESNTGKRARDE